MRLDVTLDDREVGRLFDSMEKRGRSLAKAFRTIRPHMRADQREHASRREGPETAWPQRAQSTIEHFKRGKSGRKLTRRPLGKLVSAVTYSASGSSVMAKSRVPWSGVHQHGGRVGRGSVLPARPFLWISDKLVRVASGILARFVVGGR